MTDDFEVVETDNGTMMINDKRVGIGSYVMKIEATSSDQSGQTSTLDSDICNLEIQVVNFFPTAEINIDGEQSRECTGLTTAVNFDGSGSTDPNGHDLSYYWFNKDYIKSGYPWAVQGDRPKSGYQLSLPYDQSQLSKDWLNVIDQSKTDYAKVFIKDNQSRLSSSSTHTTYLPVGENQPIFLKVCDELNACDMASTTVTIKDTTVSSKAMNQSTLLPVFYYT